MDLSTTASAEDLARIRSRSPAPATSTPSSSSAVSWAAIVAGAAATASLSLILLILGVGLGLSSVSPWANTGVSAKTFGVSTIVWLTVTQLLAAAMGGYLAGRLRTKWTEVHTDEVYFRDTAHGFLAWAVASLATAALLSSAINSIVSNGVQAEASVVGGITSSAAAVAGGVAASANTTPGRDGGSLTYFVDSLFRRNADTDGGSPGTAGATAGTDASALASGKDDAEVSHIFTNVGRSQPLPPEDIRYVGQIVAARTGLSQADAEKRVSTVFGKAQAKLHDAEVAARDAADESRKAASYSALWLFVSLLIGAFVASLSATFGGRRRDA